jgi:hypothetical protein
MIDKFIFLIQSKYSLISSEVAIHVSHDIRHFPLAWSELIELTDWS